jgi:CRP/FNR family transcriptional regulator/CRP/FNR family cyclic AMP-dependent transcriptional regulator
VGRVPGATRPASRDYDPLVSQTRPPADLAALRGVLESVPLFRDLSEPDLDLLAAGLRTRRFRRGEVIFHQGDPGDALHIILSGRVKISSPSETGVEAILTTLRPGEFFGSLALLDGAPRSASATAVEPTETLILPRDRFRQLLSDWPEIRDHVFEELARELRRLTFHVEELHFLDIAGRLAARIARMAEEQGSPNGDGEIRLQGPITQGELAAMVGSTRQSVNKLLGYFTDDGLIRIDRDAIVVRDLAGLQLAARR